MISWANAWLVVCKGNPTARETETKWFAAGSRARVQRVGFFNFGTDRVRVLEKTSGSGSGMDRVRVLAPHFL